jgi:PAS domain S-box-containing protein
MKKFLDHSNRRETGDAPQARFEQTAEPRDLVDLINLAYDAIIVRTAADRILFWNWGAERLYGWAAEDVIGRNATELWQTSFPQPIEEIRRALLRNKRWEGELSQLRRDGSRVTVASRWALRRGVDRQFKILQINRDITKGREVEEERVRLLSRLVQSQEKERRRFSRELHDHFGQQLTALRIGLEALRNPNWERRRLGEHLDELQSLARRLDTDVGFLAWDLRTSTLDNLGLVSAITAFVHEWSKHFGIPADFQTSSLADHRFSPEIETNLYRIAQEALNNVSKHAQANRVDVILDRRNNQLALIVEDDGIGFDPQQEVDQNHAGKGLGLVSMRERALLIGGNMEIESSSGGGTTVYVRVPLEPHDL